MTAANDRIALQAQFLREQLGGRHVVEVMWAYSPHFLGPRATGVIVRGPALDALVEHFVREDLRQRLDVVVAPIPPSDYTDLGRLIDQLEATRDDA